MKWQVLHKKSKYIIKCLFENRNLKTKKEINNFISPANPKDIKIEELGITQKSLQKILKRLETAKEKNEKIVIFGDYDADGVCSTAILWEEMYKLGFDAMPYIPDRFEEGYGIKVKSFVNSKFESLNPKLIITVDNGIVAYEGIKRAKELGVDVIVVDHHQKGEDKLDTSYILHSTVVCGSALSWFLSRELALRFGTLKQGSEPNTGLDLVALGTIADQMPLLGINRSLVKFGLPELTKTKRVGLQKMFRDTKIDTVGVYEVGYVIAPRINAMGRLASATDSLRFLCTRDPKKASGFNDILNETNIERQKIVDDVLTQVLKQVQDNDKIIVIEGKYHEGVIGLASGKVTEKYYKPSIVLSVGELISKASARSINGFNIIEAIKETGLILEGGGHPMAAGFSIETTKIEQFKLKINELSNEILTDEILERKLKIDMEIKFENITNKLVDELRQFEPTGQGNYSPIFMSSNVKVKEVKPVGQEGKHLKLKLEQNGVVFNAIYFGGATNPDSLTPNHCVSVAYAVEENVWNDKISIQLKVKDVRN